MDNIFRRSGFEVPEHVRRFLHGEADSSLRIKEYQDGSTLIVRADLPGVDPDNGVDITITDDTLHILARRDEKAEHKTKTGYRPEIRYGEFTRSIALPRGVNQEDITATYVDGVLEIRVRLPERLLARNLSLGDSGVAGAVAG